MFRNQLTALEHPTPDAIDFSDQTQFASTILWLEDQKIRHYKIEEREALRLVGTSDDWLPAWEIAYRQYKSDVRMPENKSPLEEMSWLLSLAVRYEYMDNAEEYAHMTAAKVTDSSRPAQPTVASNELDNLDMESPEFQQCVKQLADKLSMGDHPDQLVRLRAVAHFVNTKLRPEARADPVPTGVAFPIKEGGKCAFDDKDVDMAAKILRLLQIHNVRALQTVINETIVMVQHITANPKTDCNLGRVGMK